MGGTWDDAKDPLYWEYRRPKAGVHYGAINGNRSVTVLGEPGMSDTWVLCTNLKRKNKQEGWEKMNFTDYQKMNKEPSNKTCLQLILETREPNYDAMKELQQRRW